MKTRYSLPEEFSQEIEQGLSEVGLALADDLDLEGMMTPDMGTTNAFARMYVGAAVTPYNMEPNTAPDAPAPEEQGVGMDASDTLVDPKNYIPQPVKTNPGIYTDPRDLRNKTQQEPNLLEHVRYLHRIAKQKKIGY